MNERVISEIRERLKRDRDAFKRVLQSFGIIKNPLPLRNFSSIFQLFVEERFKQFKAGDPTRRKSCSGRFFKVNAINERHSELCENEPEISN